MYQVLYRKYRPAVFADVYGQPQVTATLKNELKAGRVAHAYLFTGSRGTGKTTCAKILAKAVNCLHPVDGDPCGECEICRGIDNGSILDVVEIDAASNNGVDNIRALREEAHFTPGVAKYRVYIIDEVHMLSIGAFNALLKTLEEPPPHVVFILATTEVHKLPATILSRCQRFDFGRIAPEDIYARLADVAKQEGVEIDRDAGLLIARLADGGMRDALSLFDQCLGRDRHVTLEVVNQTAGLAGRDHLVALTDAIVQKNSAPALELIASLHAASKDMMRLCEEMITYFRGLMLIKTMKDASDMVLASADELQKMTAQAVSMSLPDILHGLDTFRDTLEHMARSGNQRVDMEMAMIRLCAPELDDSVDALLRRITALENALRSGSFVAAPAEKPAVRVEQPVRSALPVEAKTEAPVSSPAVERDMPSAVPPEETPAREEPAAADAKEAPRPARMSLADMQNQAEKFKEWPEILQNIKQYSRSVAAAFVGSTAYVAGNYVLIDAPEVAFELLRRPAQRDHMRDAIRQVTGKTYNLGPWKKNQPAEEEADPLKLVVERAKELGVDVTLEESES